MGSSFYSEKYLRQRRLRLKRQRRLRLAAAILAVIFLIAIFINSKVKEYHAKKEALKIAEEKKTQEKEKEVNSLNVIKHLLSDGREVLISYSLIDGKIHYDSADLIEGSCWVDFSPDSTKVLINEAFNQTITIYDKDRKMKDYSLEEFDYAGTGKMLRSYYSTKPGFIWANKAKFLNDNIIVFTSQVSLAVKPYFLWAIDLNTGRKTLIEETRSSEKLEVIERNKDGLIIESDGMNLQITGDLKVQGVVE